MERDPRIYVDHMLEAIANIETDTAVHDYALARIREMLAVDSDGK